jgi:ABC-type Fe3+ transport system permease subunit
MLGGWLVAMLLAGQEFAVFEPTGISVIATEVRAVFETGASLDQQWGGVDQAGRTAAALGVMLPTVGWSLAIVWMIAGWSRRANVTSDAGHSLQAPVRLGVGVHAVAWMTPTFLLLVPLAALVASLRAMPVLGDVVEAHLPRLIGSARLGLATGLLALAMMVCAQIVRARVAMIVAIASFVVGGQWIAIALIRLFNRNGLFWVYDSDLMPTLAYLSRFAWIGLFAAAVVWRADWRWLREQAQIDGAGSFQLWLRVLLPTSWPLLAAASLLIVGLSMTEVAATTLLAPAETMVPMMMSNAHTLSYDPMIEACLLLVGMVMVVSLTAMGLFEMHGRSRRTMV